MTQPKNIVVIGAGIVGTSIAVNLIQYGANITVIDKDTQTNGASRLSFAWINAAGKTPFDYHDLNRRSMEMWPRYAQSLGRDVGFKVGGTITWETSEQRGEALINKVKRAQSYGYPIRLATQNELQNHEPNLTIENVVAASICEIEGQVEPPRVIQAAIDKIIESGGEVSLGEAFENFEFDSTDHLITGVKTTNRTLPCDLVVVAAGIDTTDIGYKAHTFLPQSTSPGVVVKTSPMPPLLNGIVYAPSLEEYGREVHMKQLIDGTFVIGEGEQSSKNTDDSIENAKRLVEVGIKEGCKNSFLVNNNNDIPWTKIDNIETLGLSSGASTPEVLIKNVIKEAKKRYYVNLEEITIAEEDIIFNLPRVI